MAQKPVIFLAFANDRVDDTAYLRNLSRELDGIRNALQQAVKAGLCEVVERTNATIKQIIDVFQDAQYKDRIAIFHYGGHANGYQLLLENLDGTHAVAHAQGLVPFFAKQQGLQLVFLNGCSSQQQAFDLVEAGISAVIGTSQSINDDVATNLAIRFYSGLASGATLLGAWQTAVDEAKITKGTANMRDFYWAGMSAGNTLEAERFPWEIHFREGAEQMREWNLPETTNNDLFGLPEIPKTHHLPNEPFLFFQKYSRAYAEVFFGRSAYIRKLYNLVTDANLPPIALFFGLSGAGKSSLLEAGLLPRIETNYQAVYVRRNQDLGILQSVISAFEGLLHTQELTLPNRKKETEELAKLIAHLADLATKFKHFDSEIKQFKVRLEAKQVQLKKNVEGNDLASLWHRLERQSGKAVVLLLDQVEETFTFGNAQQEEELGSFLDALKSLFGNRANAPQGRIVLTYRKEFAPELERAFNQLQLPFSKAFLLQLTRNQIIEIIMGLTKVPILQQKYNLKVAPTLPEVIADDLLEDKDSPIAPILQILLTKMWQKANEANPDAPEFTVELYQELKYKGLLMEDFLQQQLEKLKEMNQEAASSGLALDVLFFHTNKMGTSMARPTASVLERYKGREEQIEVLLGQLESLYLLNRIASTTRKLSHDTLSMLVRQLYGESVMAGQRASRILQYKMMDIKAGNESLLSSSDLHTIENGRNGMRTLLEEEEQLVTNSARDIKSKEIYQHRKEIRISVLENENQEKDAEVYLQKIEERVQEAKRKKHDNSLEIIREAHERYPDHPLTKRLVYSLLNNYLGESEEIDYSENFTQAQLPILGPPDDMESEEMPAVNGKWKVKISFPSKLTIYNQYGYEKAEINVSIRDYGVFHSLAFAQNADFMVLATTDGLVKMFDMAGTQLLELGDMKEESPYHFRNAIFSDFDSKLICQSEKGVFSYSLNTLYLMGRVGGGNGGGLMPDSRIE